MLIQYAEAKDFKYLMDHDQHAQPLELTNLINLKRILIARQGSKIVGWLRWNLFKDNTPFMNYLAANGQQADQIAFLLMKKWEELMRANNFPALMTATISDQPKQDFYQHLGFAQSGVLNLPDEQRQIILSKQI